MPDNALCDELASFFSERLNVSVPDVEADLFEAGILDSLAFVDLVLYLEQHFGIQVAADELEPDDFRSLGRIAGFVAAHRCVNQVGAA